MLLDEADISLPGIYPVVLRVTYQDANLYSFSMLDVIPTAILHNNPGVAEVEGTLEISEISGTGKAVLQLKNMSNNFIQGSARLLLPEELHGETREWEYSSEAGQEERFDLLLEKSGALAGSSYRVFAVLEYDHKGMHFTKVSSAQAVIGKSVSEGVGARRRIAGAIVFIGVLFALTVYAECFGKKGNAG